MSQDDFTRERLIEAVKEMMRTENFDDPCKDMREVISHETHKLLEVEYEEERQALIESLIRARRAYFDCVTRSRPKYTPDGE